MPGKIQTFHGAFETLPAGAKLERREEERAIAAVVSGRVRLELGGEAVILRASDAATLPARAAYRLEALEDSVLYRYREPGEDTPWAV